MQVVVKKDLILNSFEELVFNELHDLGWFM